jgi:hypothetical protein
VGKLSCETLYECRHKSDPQAFTRTRKLPFRSVLQILLRKGVKSLQLALNEWGEELDERISASALSQARQKFRHTAFIELHEKAVVDVMYGDGDYKTFRGHRLLAVDCSSLRLPPTKETRERFGEIEHRDSKKRPCGSQVEAKMSVLYDVLNELALSANLHPGRTHDLPASRAHLSCVKPGDVLILDRAYASTSLFAEIVGKNAHFIVRCKRQALERYHGLFDDPVKKEVTVIIPVLKGSSQSSTVPNEVQVRFVKVVLPNGEIEILATSLLDRKKYPHKIFNSLYYKRWNVETYFHTLKSRLSIDNFTGKTVESIYQDFYSTIFVSGLETILRLDPDAVLAARDTKHQYKVNKAVSFHTIKAKIVALIFDPPPDLEQQIHALLLQNPVSVRPFRQKIRLKKDNSVRARASAYYQKCQRKHVF